MTKRDVTFEEPPAKRDERYDWSAIAASLREHPNKWAKVFDRDRTSLATAIRIKGIAALHPDKGFEVRTANNMQHDPEFDNKRTCTLYLRYVPEKNKAEE